MRILIVEDDIPSRQLLEHLLAGLGTCETADNGRQAFEAVQRAMDDKRPFGLICMDIMMPEMDGMEALKKIRRLEIAHRIPATASAKIVMITAKGQASDVMTAYNSGCEAYLLKPISKARLFEQLAELGLASPLNDRR